MMITKKYTGYSFVIKKRIKCECNKLTCYECVYSGAFGNISKDWNPSIKEIEEITKWVDG